MILDFRLLYDMFVFDLFPALCLRRFLFRVALSATVWEDVAADGFQTSALPFGSRFGASPHSEACQQSHPPFISGGRSSLSTAVLISVASLRFARVSKNDKFLVFAHCQIRAWVFRWHCDD